MPIDIRAGIVSSEVLGRKQQLSVLETYKNICLKGRIIKLILFSLLLMGKIIGSDTKEADVSEQNFGRKIKIYR